MDVSEDEGTMGIPDLYGEGPGQSGAEGGSGSCNDPAASNPAASNSGGERVLFSSSSFRPKPRPQELQQLKGKPLSYRTDSVRSELARTLNKTSFELGKNQGGNEVFEAVNVSGPSGSPGSGGFPPAYNIIRAGKQMKLNSCRLGTVAGLGRYPTKIGYPAGGLAALGDGRAFCALNYHCAEKGVNMALSIGRPVAGGGGGTLWPAWPAPPHTI